MNPQTVLALDIGIKRIGIASGQTLTQTAHPAGQISVTNNQPDWPTLDKLIKQWQPSLIIIGNPNTQDSNLRKVINRIKHHIQQHHKITLKDIDERLTSDAANAELSAAKLSQSRKIKLRDQIAACLILQTYFNTLKL